MPAENKLLDPMGEWTLVAVDENIHDLGVILRRVVDVPKMCFVNLVLAVKYSGNSL